MAWGYERCFTIEHDTTVKKKIDCKSCIYYESDDKSCMKRPLYLPEDGYNSWRNCKYFELDSATSNYDSKKAQYDRVKKNAQTESKTAVSKSTAKVSSTGKDTVKLKAILKSAGKPLAKGYKVCPVEYFPKVKPMVYEYVNVTLKKGKRIKVQVAYYELLKHAYVNKRIYSEEAIECLKSMQN